MHCEIITMRTKITIKLINTDIPSYTFLFSGERQDLFSQQISSMKYSIIKYSHHAVH